MLEDLASSYSNNGFESPYEKAGDSIWDTRAQTTSSNNFSKSAFGELNFRESNYGSMSVLDKMRGLNPARLDNSSSIGLAEQYADKDLDKRVFNGVYNVTLTDIYTDEKTFKGHFGLHTDSFIEEEEKASLEGDMAVDNGTKAKNDRGTVGIISGALKMKTESINENTDFDIKKDSTIIGSDNTKYRLQDTVRKKDPFSKKEKTIEELSEEAKESQNKEISKDTNKKNEEYVRRVKEIKLKYGEEILTNEEVQEFLITGSSSADIFLSFTKIQEKMKKLEEDLKLAIGPNKDIIKKKIYKLKKIQMRRILE